MKVLILSVTAGEGHNSTAKAICRILEERGVHCQITDTFLSISRMMYDIISKGYLLATADFKKLYGKFYYHFEKRKSNSFIPSPTRFAYRTIAWRIRKAIEAYDPDVIVCTHCFPAMMVDVIMQKHPFRARSVGVVTDFVMHPYWEEALRLDRLVVANEQLISAARRKGFAAERILPLGIPIHPKFATAVPKQEARAKLGLDTDKSTLLIMSGSMGHGKMIKVLKELDSMQTDFQMIVVCGNNKEIYNNVQKEAWRKRVLNLGFADNIPLLMDASDCIISKPGGLTTSEALAKRLPMIICNPIAGQEERNAEFLQNCGAAMAVSGAYSVSDAVHQFFHFSYLAESMQTAIEVIRKPHAAQDLCEEILRLGEESKNEIP